MEERIDSIIGKCLGKLQIPKTRSVPEFGSISVKSVGSIRKLSPCSPSEKYSCLKIQTDLDLLPVSQLAKKGDGDKIDVVAPASIITQLGKIPYSEEAGLSIGVQLLDKILVLGPAIEEEEEHPPGSSNDDVQAEQFCYEVLTFLQEYCNVDPGAYWLHVGEDAIQLFYFPSIPKNLSSNLPLPSSVYKARIDSLMAFGKLLLRVAHRLSFSTTPEAEDKCVEYLRKCLELLNEPDHLVVRACVEEQFARLILDKKLDSAEAFMLHMSGAINSLGWSRQLQYADDESAGKFYPICSCACEATCCADVDVREWLPTSLIDDKLWKLVFMMGEFFFGLAFKKSDENWKISSKVPDELRRLDGQIVGIFKYIEVPEIMGDDDFLTAGFICLESARKGLGKLPICLLQKMGKCYLELENRYQHASKEAIDLSKAYIVCCKMGEVSLELAKCWEFYLMENPDALDGHASILHTKMAVKHFLLAENVFTKIDKQKKDNAYRNEVNAKHAKSHVLMARFLIATNVEPRETEKALLDAIAIYEKLGVGDWKLESSVAYLLLSEHHAYLCSKESMSDEQQKMKHHLYLAKKYIQKAVDPFSPERESDSYLDYHMMQSELYLKFPPCNQNTEIALECLLKARHIPETNVTNDELRDKFWKQLNSLLRHMCFVRKDEVSASTSSSKQTKAQRKDQVPASRSSSKQTKAQKLRELYKMAMQSKDFGKLNSMHTIWTS